MATRIIVEVAGGCVQDVHGVAEWTLLDWDNLLADIYTRGDTEREWARFDDEMKMWIASERPDEYAKVQARILEDRQWAEEQAHLETQAGKL